MEFAGVVEASSSVSMAVETSRWIEKEVSLGRRRTEETDSRRARRKGKERERTGESRESKREFKREKEREKESERREWQRNG